MDLIEWLQSQGAKVRKGGQEYCVNCPKCGDVKKHLYVNPSLGVAHCFRCGYSGRVEEVLVEGFGLSFNEVRELLKFARELSNRNKVVADTDKRRIEFPEGSVELVKAGKGVERLLQEWCKESNVKYEDLVEMKCRWWEGRLVIPCWKDRGRRELWYWVARAVKDIEPKYINCAAPKSGVVWGIDWYDVNDDGYLYVCEGWKDAYRMKGIALLGKEITDEQVKLVLKLSERRKVRVLLDRDAWNEGVVVGMKIGRVLGYGNVEEGFLIGLKDPGEGESKGEVLENTVFVGMEDGVGKVIELIRKLRIELEGKRWRSLKV
jgi:hypothetical protein